MHGAIPEEIMHIAQWWMVLDQHAINVNSHSAIPLQLKNVAQCTLYTSRLKEVPIQGKNHAMEAKLPEQQVWQNKAGHKPL